MSFFKFLGKTGSHYCRQGCPGVPFQIPFLLYMEGKAQRGKHTYCPMFKLPTRHLILSNTHDGATISMDLQHDPVLTAYVHTDVSASSSLSLLTQRGVYQGQIHQWLSILGLKQAFTLQTALKPPGHQKNLDLSLMPSYQFHNTDSNASDFIATDLR